MFCCVRVIFITAAPTADSGLRRDVTSVNERLSRLEYHINLTRNVILTLTSVGSLV